MRDLPKDHNLDPWAILIIGVVYHLMIRPSESAVIGRLNEVRFQQCQSPRQQIPLTTLVGPLERCFVPI
jgi:hypothetical protein